MHVSDKEISRYIGILRYRDIEGDIIGISWGYHGKFIGISWNIMGISQGYHGDIMGIS